MTKSSKRGKVRKLAKRDILRELHERTTGVYSAYDFIDQVIDSPYKNLPELLGFSKEEGNAFGHGIPLKVLANWRYKGWPSICARCKRKLNVGKLVWLAYEDKRRTNRFVLRHAVCPKK